MKKVTFKPILIDTPKWADKPEVKVENNLPSDYEILQKHRVKLLSIVHREVTEYLNTDNLVFHDDEGFPNLTRMTGEYYLSDEHYETQTNPVRYMISSFTRFLETKWYDNQDSFDYLGLEVWISCNPETWEFEVQGVDSSSI